MAQFTARNIVDATPEQVLEVLTDPEEIRSWSPIPFEVDEFGGRRLHSGSVARVSGSLAGKRVGFDVAVHAADADARSSARSARYRSTHGMAFRASRAAAK